MSKLLLGGTAGAALLGYLAYKAKRGHAKRVFAPKTLGLTARGPALPAMRPVRSSMIKELGYADGQDELVVKFNDGKTYKFKGVSKSVFTRLLNAGSKGESFNRMIKNKYEHEKIGAARDPFDRVTPPKSARSLSSVLHDLRELDTPEKWYAYVDRHNSSASARAVIRDHERR
jgi:hypothetical protein